MKRFRTLLASVLALALLAFAVPAAAANDNVPNHVPGRVLVQFKAGADVDSVMKANGLVKQGQVYGSDTLILEAPGKSATALVDVLAKRDDVVYAELDYIATAAFTPNDSYYASYQWAPQKIQANLAWDYTMGSNTVLIAVVDTGVDLDHPDLINKVRTDIDWDYVNNDSTAQDDNGHGTHVAGIAAASTNNATGVAGICPNCQVLPVKVLNAAGSGSYSAIASGVRYAADKGAKVINLSLGGTSSDVTLSDAVTYANGKGSLVIAAAGNNGNSVAFYPAAYTAAVAVAATDSSDYRASFSNYGSYVDVAAPGVSIYSTYWNNTYKYLDGTSMATPNVSGLAGLLFSQGRTQTDVRTRLTSSTYTDPVNSANIGRRINAYKAVAY